MNDDQTSSLKTRADLEEHAAKVGAVPPWNRDDYNNRYFWYDAFISHASGDGSRRLFESLRSEGLTVWYDEEQYMDDVRWMERIVNGLLHCRTTLLFVGERSLDKPWIRAEMMATRAAERQAKVPRLYVIQSGSATVPDWLDLPNVEQRLFTMGEISSLVSRLRTINEIKDPLPDHRESFPELPDEYPIRCNLYRLAADLLSSEELNDTELVKRFRGSDEEVARTFAELMRLISVPNYPAGISAVRDCALRWLGTGAYDDYAIKFLRAGLANEYHDTSMQYLLNQTERVDDVVDISAGEAARALLVTRGQHVRPIIKKKLFSVLDDAQQHKALRLLLAVYQETTKSLKSLKTTNAGRSYFRKRVRTYAKCGNASECEIILRGALNEIVDGPGGYYLRDSEKCRNIADIYFDLVKTLLKAWPSDRVRSLWAIHFEDWIVLPLSVFGRYFEEQRFRVLRRKYLNELRASVTRDLDALEDFNSQAADLMRDALHTRLKEIDLLAEGCHIEQEGEYFHVGLGNRMARMRLVEKSESSRTKFRLLFPELNFSKIPEDDSVRGENPEVFKIFKAWEPYW